MILALGVAYKPDIDDHRGSPALDVIHLLELKGGDLRYHDPYVSEFEHEGWKMCSVRDLMGEVKSVDVVVIVTNDTVYNYPGSWRKRI